LIGLKTIWAVIGVVYIGLAIVHGERIVDSSFTDTSAALWLVFDLIAIGVAIFIVFIVREKSGSKTE